MASKRWMVVTVLLVVGCGDSNKQQQNHNPNNIVSNNTTSGGDMGTMSDAAMTGDDTGADATTNDDVNNVTNPAGCPDGVAADVTVDIDPAGRGGQLYARTAWDGHGAWVVYNRPDSMDAGAPEEIFVARVGCDGTVEVGPTRVSEANGNRNYMPVIASRGGVTHVAWAEQPVGMNADAIRLQILGADGQPVLAAPATITPTDPNGDPLSLTWEPDIAVWDDGTGVVAVSAGVSNSFQVVLQRYDATGAKAGAAITPFAEPGVDQKRPTVAADPDGTIYVGWTRYKAEDTTAGTPEEPERAVFTSIPAGANMAFPAAPTPAKPLTNPNPIARYSREPGPTGAFFLAFQVTTSSRNDILVRDGSDFETAESGVFGSTGWANFRPSVAASKTGGVLAWYRYNQSPLKNTLMVQPFAFNETFATGDEVVIETDTPGLPPYGPDITWAGGSAFFITWGEGDSGPQAHAKGRWILLP